MIVAVVALVAVAAFAVGVRVGEWRQRFRRGGYIDQSAYVRVRHGDGETW